MIWQGGAQHRWRGRNFGREPDRQLALGRQPPGDEAVVSLDPRRYVLPAELAGSLQPGRAHALTQDRVDEQLGDPGRQRL